MQPELTIVDARRLLTRSGPSFRAGQSEIVKGVNKLILGNDMVAIDSYCSDLMMKHDPSFSKKARVQRQLEYAVHLGLGAYDSGKIEIREVSA